MRQVIQEKQAKGDIEQPCSGCGKFLQFGGWTKRQRIVIVKEYDGDRWLSTEVWHKICHEARRLIA